MPKIEKLTHSITTGNYYFVKVGKKLSDDIILDTSRSENSEKVDVTKSMRMYILMALIRNNTGKCVFCSNDMEFKQTIETNQNHFKINLCENCPEVENKC